MPSATFPASTNFTIEALSPELRKDTLIGAEVVFSNASGPINPDTLTSDDISILRQGLYEHSVLVLKNQQGIEPLALEKLAAIWDPDIVSEHSAGKKQITDPKSILSRNNGARLPGAASVQIIGNGKIQYAGLDLNLRHVDSAEFHAQPLSQEALEDGETRFYRWHQDAPLYDTGLPGKVTILHGLIVPELPDQKIVFEDKEVMPVAAGATAFVSGRRAFQLLTPEEQEFALNTTVQYAPRAYEWISKCKATSDGLGIAQVGDERAQEDLPEWTWDKVHAFPMAYTNPGLPSQPSLQIIGCCVYSLRTKDPTTGQVTVMDDLAEVRKKVYELQKKAMKKKHVYAHRWEEGDLVIFHNYGVWHSITGQLGETKRLMWQVTMKTVKGPVGARN